MPKLLWTRLVGTAERMEPWLITLSTTWGSYTSHLESLTSLSNGATRIGVKKWSGFTNQPARGCEKQQVQYLLDSSSFWFYSHSDLSLWMYNIVKELTKKAEFDTLWLNKVFVKTTYWILITSTIYHFPICRDYVASFCRKNVETNLRIPK